MARKTQMRCKSKRIQSQKKSKSPSLPKQKKIKKPKKSKKPTKSQKSQMQSSRLHRMKTQMEKYALSSYTSEKEKITFTLINIKDSKKRKIFIKNKKDISCMCMDFKIRCKKNKIICKHICYVLNTILKLDPKIVKNLKISELGQFELSLGRIKKVLFPENKIDRELTENDLCAICFTDFMEDEKTNILGCGKCKGIVHKDCMGCWVKNSVSPGCVYCKDKTILHFV